VTVGPFLVVEGLSGTGKTALARALASALGGEYVPTPVEPYGAVRRRIDAVAPPAERYAFYLAALAGAGRKVRQLLPDGPVVCDRWLPTTQVWHEMLGVKILQDVAFLELPPPTAILLVHCREDIRQARLDSRGRDENDQAEALGQREEYLLGGYRALNLVEVDSSDREPDELASYALESLGLLVHRRPAPVP
jgi:thymidylate kinase